MAGRCVASRARAGCIPRACRAPNARAPPSCPSAGPRRDRCARPCEGLGLRLGPRLRSSLASSCLLAHLLGRIGANAGQEDLSQLGCIELSQAVQSEPDPGGGAFAAGHVDFRSSAVPLRSFRSHDRHYPGAGQRAGGPREEKRRIEGGIAAAPLPHRLGPEAVQEPVQELQDPAARTAIPHAVCIAILAAPVSSSCLQNERLVRECSGSCSVWPRSRA
jgi:hypothetical protein